MSKNSMTREQLQARIDQLEREQAELKAQKANTVKVAVSDKGCLLIYGFRRFPIALYRKELTWILDNDKALRVTMKANEPKLPLERGE